MARINIEDAWWTDPRRFTLAERMGSLYAADGLACAAWRIAQQFWGNGRCKIPFLAFKQIEQHELLIELDLAVKHGTFVYVRGTRQYLDWYASVKAGAAKGGKTKRKEPKLSSSFLEAKSKSLTPTLTPDLDLTKKQEEEGRVGQVFQAELSLVPPLEPRPNPEPEPERPGFALGDPAGPPPRPKSHPLVRIWNENRGTLPEVKALSSSRRRHADARWREKPEEEHWAGVIRRIAASAFCSGDNQRGWRADFDFLVRPDTHVRTIEGKYDNRAKEASGKPMNWDYIFGKGGQHGAV